MTDTFMSDDIPAYYNAYREVVGQPKNHLLCSWHVIRNWNKHLIHVSDMSLRNELKRDLLSLQRELDRKEFHDQLTFFKNKYHNRTGCEKFIEYFQAYYVGRVEMWSLAYQVNLGINTNMHLENFHR